MTNERNVRPHWCAGLARLGIAAVLFLAACARAETPRITPTPFRLRLIVDASMAPLARALTDAYAKYLSLIHISEPTRPY